MGVEIVGERLGENGVADPEPREAMRPGNVRVTRRLS
jgi:hypothetical protein